MATRVRSDPADLHEVDFYVWAQRQAAALRKGRLEELDLEYLAEEVQDLADGRRSAVRSRARTIMEHLLKLRYSPATPPRNGWRETVRTQRDDLEDDLTPSLREHLQSELELLYAKAHKRAAAAMRDRGEAAEADRLPKTCPYTLDQITGDWLP